jgi:hypothetical protein
VCHPRTVTDMETTGATEATAVTATAPEALACPRCGGDIAGETYYGPCTGCRAALRGAYAGEARDIEVAAYEPKMNVTPNAVALKDD